ncbi:MAG: aldehyde dehydrogenase family protein [Bacteroidota bacterium]
MDRSEDYASPEEIQEAFQTLRDQAPAVRQRTAKERIRQLKALEKELMRRRDQLKQAVYEDFKKPPEEVDLTELYPVLLEIRHTVKYLKEWMAPQGVTAPLPLITTRSHIQYEPKGTVLIIAPWNYPFNLLFGPLISALAAGNTILLKPSELAPHTSAFMKELVEDFFDPQEVRLLEGAVEETQELLKLPFDHIFFTGSPRVGKIVMKAAAEHLTSVTLELGGKSPTVVHESARIKDAADKIIYGKCTNAGQTCIAPDYILVQESVKEALVEHLKESIQQLYGSPDQWVGNQDFAHIISDQHWNRLKQMRDEAVEQGAQLETNAVESESDRFLGPALLVDPPNHAQVLEEEIFGPLLPIISFSQLDEAIRFINDKPKPLAMYIFSRDKKVTDQLLHRTSAGGTCVNDTLLHFLHMELPFGGVNNSGMGKAHGFDGFKAFSNERAVLQHNLRFSALKALYPPYTNFKQKLVDILIRWIR